MIYINKLKKIILIASFILPVILLAQSPKPLNWYNLDREKDSVVGISMDKAYATILKDKKPVTVIVAIIDGGADTAHEDLKPVLWRNKKEIPGNGKDDDRNGYADDVNGWNFLSWSKGNIIQENEEIVRVIRKYKLRFGDKDSTRVAKKDKEDYKKFQQLQKELAERRRPSEQKRQNLIAFKSRMDSVLARMKNKNPGTGDFKNYAAANNEEENVKTVMIRSLPYYPDFKTFIKYELEGPLQEANDELDYKLNLDFDPRSGEAAAEFKERKKKMYGSGNILTADADHGTHVSGIVGAARKNNIGINGVADAVQVMNLRVVPDGDERDQDIAAAIRYAVDNGAKVINMSFGKSFSPDKKIVDAAVKYAMKKNVLLVHSAGNDGKDLDKKEIFPNRNYLDGGIAAAWIEVGAADSKDNATLPASFSNYGVTTVNVYAPGVGIYSTVPGNKYEAHSGTSMSAPVVTGLAATLMAYYPTLSAAQVKEIIINSVVKFPSLANKCSSGGIVNAYNACLLAESIK